MRINKVIKAIRCMLVGIISASMLLSNVAFAETTELKTAEIVFDQAPVLTNVTSWSVSETTNREFVQRDGKTGLLRDPSTKDYFVCVNVADSYWYTEAASKIAVTVEYYDEGTGTFTLRYDSAQNGQWASPGDIVKMTGSNEWKTHTFYLDDALLKNGLIGGTDIELGLWSSDMGASPEAIVIRSMRIDEQFPSMPVASTISTGHIGNIYGKNDTDTLIIKLGNVSPADVQTQMKYTIYDEDKNVIKTKTTSYSLGARASQEIAINTGITKYGVYTIVIDTISEYTYDGETKTVTSSSTYNLSKVLTTEGTDSKNEYVNFCSQLQQKNITTTTEKIIELAAAAGASGMRDEYYWSNTETTKGEYALSEAFTKRMKYLSDNDLDTLQILAYNNALYSGSNSITLAPNTDAEREGFANYAKYMASTLKDTGVNKFEVWNEWNHSGFNNEDAGAASYVKLLKAAYDAIKSEGGNPNAEVYGLAAASADKSFLTKVLFYSGDEYMDGITYHPYQWDGEFSAADWIADIKDMQNVMSIFEVDLPVIFSEVGWTTAECETGVTEKEQAINLVQMTILAKAKKLADEIYWYNLVDSGPDLTDQEHNFGLLRYEFSAEPLSAKPGYVSMAAMNRFMAEMGACENKIEKNSYETVAYSFAKESDGKIAVLWSEAANGTKMNLQLGCESITAYDMYGNVISTPTSASGAYTFNLDDEPIYIEGEFTSFTEVDIVPAADVTANDPVYNADKNILYLSGTAAGIDKFTIELAKGGATVQTIECNVTADGSFSKVISPDADGEYMIYFAKKELGLGITKQVSVSRNTYAERDYSNLQTGVGISMNAATRDVTITGEAPAFEEGDNLTVVVVKEGILPKDAALTDIIYCDTIDLDSSEFEFIFKMPAAYKEGNYDVYLGGTFAYSSEQHTVGYDLVRVSTLSLDKADSTITASATMKNTNSSKKSAIIIVAQYDSNGRMVSVETESVTLPENTFENITETLEVSLDAKTVTIKGFVWDSFDTIKPLFESIIK